MIRDWIDYPAWLSTLTDCSVCTIRLYKTGP